MKLILKSLMLISLVVALAVPVIAAESTESAMVVEQPDPIKMKFLNDFPNLADTQLNPTPIANMYEVVAAGRILYYFPRPHI